MSVPPSAATSSDRLPVKYTRSSRLPFHDAPGERESANATLGGNVVGVVTAVAFVTFLVTYIASGQRAASIAFWAVEFGLPAAVVLVSFLAAAWTGRRRRELLEVAMLAIRLAEQRNADNPEKGVASKDPDAGPAGDFPEDVGV